MEFKQSVKEALAYYVYALVDPRDHKIFYFRAIIQRINLFNAFDTFIPLMMSCYDIGQLIIMIELIICEHINYS